METKNVPRILVVDDDKYISALIKRTLDVDGYSVTTVGDGQAALDILKELKPDLILLDIKMPGMDGYETLKNMRLETTVPIIMLTGIVESAAVAQALNSGADDYIRKPFLANELLARIRSKLRRRS
jgi:DNA-binding response OmpR family regulator